MNNRKNKALILVDNSYFTYCILFGAVNEFKNLCPEEAEEWLKPTNETDQEHLPNLLDNENYRKILKNFTMKRIESIDYVLQYNCQDIISSVENIDIIFAVDDDIMHNFRKKLYPQYKAQRLTTPKQFNVSIVKKYIGNVIYPELELEEKHGFRFIHVNGAEGDDVIATLAQKHRDDYLQVVIISSDRDFLQIDNVLQYDIYGKRIERKIANEELTPNEYLLHKIIVGDSSDNIQNVFYRVGEKKALKLIRENKEKLVNDIKTDFEVGERYKLNRQLIDFKFIPSELQEDIERIFEITIEELDNNRPKKFNIKDYVDSLI